MLLYRQVERYQNEENEIISEINSLLHTLSLVENEDNSQKAQEIMQQIELYNEKFNDACDKVWYAVMDTEISLHERSDESIESFSQVARGLMNEFVEYAQILLMNLRNICDEYFDKLLKCILEYLHSRSSVEDIPENISKVTEQIKH